MTVKVYVTIHCSKGLITSIVRLKNSAFNRQFHSKLQDHSKRVVSMNSFNVYFKACRYFRIHYQLECICTAIFAMWRCTLILGLIMYGRPALVLNVNIFIPRLRFDMQQPSRFLCLLNRKAIQIEN